MLPAGSGQLIASPVEGQTATVPPADAG